MKTTPILVVGNGRSGTNLLGRLIASHPQVESYIEAEPIFQLVTKAAFYGDELSANTALQWYRQQLRKCKKPYLLDKSHPNLWLIPHYHRHGFTPHLVGIRRNVYDTVASGMEHKGVLNWHLRNDLPMPCRPLGMTKANRELSLAAQLALRWKAHVQELRLHVPHVIEYEDLVESPRTAIEMLSLGELVDDIDFSIVKPPATHVLPDRTIEEIDDALIHYSV